MIKKIFLLLSVALLCTPMIRSQRTKVNVSIVSNYLSFDVSFDGKQVISSSPLGMNIDHDMLGMDVSITPVNVPSEQTSSMQSQTYCISKNGAAVCFVDVKAFDDGMALRYRIPADGPRCIYTEQTSFTFPEGTTSWYASGPFQYGWLQEYQTRSMDGINGQLLAPPATFLLPNGLYVALTEANLINFHGAVLFGREHNRVQFGYVENKGHIETGTITGIPDSKYWHVAVRDVPWIVSPAAPQNEIVTPWRVLMIGKDLNELVNNDIIAQVSNKPDASLFPKGRNTDWIKPGRAVFTWLVEGNDRLSVANHKRYVDGAAELGLQYVVVDDGWEQWPETEKDANGRTKWQFLQELVDYAKPKNVGIWVWRPSSPRAGNKKDIGLVDAAERADFMKRCADIGVKGLKIDFFHTENLFTVHLMENILKDAAKEHLMVIFHGVNKPTGDSYTYPNLLAKEAVRGLECVGAENSWAPGPPWPYHNTVLPFTRWLAGPADYTPLNFRRNCPPSVSFTQQLASIYMFTSPMLILAADMEDMLNCPGRQFIEEVPVVWDETRVLPESRIGKIAAIARRSGSNWYLTVMNGETPYQGELTIDFLPKGNYHITYAFDKDHNYKQINMAQGRLKVGKKDGILKMDLLPGGGYLAKIVAD